MTNRYRISCVVLLLAFMTSASRAELSADGLLLVCNKKMPESVDLARHYAQVRNVPLAQILQLDLPVAEKMSAANYDSLLAGPVRTELEKKERKDIRCVVLFYGVPLQVGETPLTPAVAGEIKQSKARIAELDKKIVVLIDELEVSAKEEGLIFSLAAGKNESADVRAQRVINGIATGIKKLPPDSQKSHAEVLERQMTGLVGIAVDELQATADKSSSTKADGTTRPATAEAPSVPRPPDAEQMRTLSSSPDTVEKRVAMQQLVGRSSGAVALRQVLSQQVQRLEPKNTAAAVDSELCLVRTGIYPRENWGTNTLNWRRFNSRFPVTMVCRIDAPTVEQARKIIDDSMATEAAGLTGSAVFDSRGIPEGKDAYGRYDEKIRRAATWTKEHTKLKVVTDDKEPVIAAGQEKDVALYCGWYSLRRYVAGMEFHQGAVGYHIASFELLTLRNPNERGWVAGLLKDHISSTLGAVAEPYLSAFPEPDEFFPLLMTGRLTLAEVYWRTNPMTSWKIVFIGDPLYRPFAKNPAAKWEDLPNGMAAALDKIENDNTSGR